jgi:arsenite methyltransferase
MNRRNKQSISELIIRKVFVVDRIASIDKRYSSLAKTQCCLSCGGAIGYAKPQDNEICVDLGSGRGNDCIRLAESVGSKGFVYGIDISDGMIENARENVRIKNIGNIEFRKSSIESIPIHENTVDLLISNCTINHASDKETVWSEVYRVLKAGGRFVVSDIYSLETVPVEYRNDPFAVSECWAGSVTRNDYLTTLEQTGFIKLEVLEESEPYEKGKISVASFTIRGFKPLI